MKKSITKQVQVEVDFTLQDVIKFITENEAPLDRLIILEVALRPVCEKDIKEMCDLGFRFNRLFVEMAEKCKVVASQLEMLGT